MLYSVESNLNHAFAKDNTLPWTDMNLSKSQDVYSKDGVLKTAITVDYHIGKIDNRTTTLMLYNVSLPGPILHVYPGDKIELDLINNLNQSTNLHLHGAHVSPANNSDNVFIEVLPGKTQHYSIDIPKNHPPGMLWYHSHLHEVAYGQVSAGLSGLLIVEGTEKLLPESLQNITKQTFALRDFPFERGSNATSYRTVNGEINPAVNITSGETQLWRFANIGPEKFFKVQLPGQSFNVIAEDGSPVWEVWNNDTLLLPSGKRFDVLVTAPENGSIPLKALAYLSNPETTLATVNVKGNHSDMKTVDNLPTSLVPKKDLNLANITNHRVLNFSSLDKEHIFKIDNETFNGNRVDQLVKLGTVEEWKLVNLDGKGADNDHPFHIHVNDFQVISVNGKPYHAHGVQDTVLIPGSGEVVIRISFDDFVGKSVYHCHLMYHEDNGMMGTFEVVK